MNFKSVFLGIAMAASMVPAMAAFAIPTGDQTIDLSTGSALFANSGTLLADGDDVITFTGLSSGNYDFTVSVTGKYISNLAATLNGQALNVGIANPPFRFLFLEGQSSAPFALTLTGSGVTNSKAGYSVDISVSAVPEPESYAMLLAGLGVMATIARRRNKKAA